MASIFPDTAKGGIIVSSGGVATGATGVTNAFLPNAGFTVTCPVTAYGDGPCSWQLAGAALNAVNTELATFAQSLNPTGTWNCATTGNIAANVTAWLAGTGPGSLGDYINIALAAYVPVLQTYGASLPLPLTVAMAGRTHYYPSGQVDLIVSDGVSAVAVQIV